MCPCNRSKSQEHMGTIQNWTYSSSEARRRTLAEVAIQRRRRSSVSGSRPSDAGFEITILVVFL